MLISYCYVMFVLLNIVSLVIDCLEKIPDCYQTERERKKLIELNSFKGTLMLRGIRKNLGYLNEDS